MTTGRAAIAWLISLLIVLVIVMILIVIVGLAVLRRLRHRLELGAIPVVTVSP